MPASRSGKGNEVTIAAERVTLGVGVPFRLTGPLRIAGPRRLELDPSRLVVVGIPLPNPLMRFVLQRFEGASDLSPLPFPVQSTGVQTAPGTLTLAGTADVAAILNAPNQESDGIGVPGISHLNHPPVKRASTPRHKDYDTDGRSLQTNTRSGRRR